MPELGGDTPIEKCLEDASTSGFSGIELGGKFPRNPGITKYLLEKFNLKMPGGWYGAMLRERSVKEEWIALQDHLNLLKLINADVFVFADISGSIQGDQSKALSKRPILEKDEWDSYCKKSVNYLIC
jgi:inosose dehydratase